MAKNYGDITLALAGICQSAELVQQLANQGRCDNEPLLASLKSIFQTNPQSTSAVFGDNVREVQLGLSALMSILNSRKDKHSMVLTRYVISLMVLERKLHAQPAAMGDLAQRIEKIDRQLTHFDCSSDTIQGALADVYVDVISPLGSRIQVLGDQNMLQRTDIQAKVRAALLAGIRATVLWQQVGGSRLQLVFFRNRIFQQAQQFIAQC